MDDWDGVDVTEHRQPTATEDTPTEDTPTALGWCAWHHNMATGVRLITLVEQGSGPGTHSLRFACRPCIATHGLTPLTDQP